MCTRLGLSRIEVLIWSTIGLIVVGIVMVGISRVREAANLAHCRNNLRQLGLAVLNYDSSCGRLPCLTDQGDGTPTGRHLQSVFARLRPYIESSFDLYLVNKTPEYYHAPFIHHLVLS